MLLLVSSFSKFPHLDTEETDQLTYVKITSTLSGRQAILTCHVSLVRQKSTKTSGPLPLVLTSLRRSGQRKSSLMKLCHHTQCTRSNYAELRPLSQPGGKKMQAKRCQQTVPLTWNVRRKSALSAIRPAQQFLQVHLGHA